MALLKTELRHEGADLTKARTPNKVPSTAPLPWPASDGGYPIPWFNGGGP